jgi:hypothetical protein
MAGRLKRPYDIRETTIKPNFTPIFNLKFYQPASTSKFDSNPLQTCKEKYMMVQILAYDRPLAVYHKYSICKIRKCASPLP